MAHEKISRRQFLRTGSHIAIGAAAGSIGLHSTGCTFTAVKPVVSISKIKNGRIDVAVERAMDLLGGIDNVAKNREKILLKPNLSNALASDTTHPDVVETLARLMQKAGKDVTIGEGSASAEGFNTGGGRILSTKEKTRLDPMQELVFDELGYTELADTLKIPLVNFHSGELAELTVPEGFVFETISLHRSLIETDLLCSIPMMKTHRLATVTLGMKNLMGTFPGSVYGSVRSQVHEVTSTLEPSGTAAAIVDVVRANKLGLVVIDGSTAMEGQGPSVGSGGQLVKMDVIIAGTNPLATDMVAADLMGFDVDEVPTFAWAHRAGMTPTKLNDIEIRTTETVVRQAFTKPNVLPWESVRETYGERTI
jgi:uncharacterized protein (DUF362 family)